MAQTVLTAYGLEALAASFVPGPVARQQFRDKLDQSGMTYAAFAHSLAPGVSDGYVRDVVTGRAPGSVRVRAAIARFLRR